MKVRAIARDLSRSADNMAVEQPASLKNDKELPTPQVVKQNRFKSNKLNAARELLKISINQTKNILFKKFHNMRILKKKLTKL